MSFGFEEFFFRKIYIYKSDVYFSTNNIILAKLDDAISGNTASNNTIYLLKYLDQIKSSIQNGKTFERSKLPIISRMLKFDFHFEMMI